MNKREYEIMYNVEQDHWWYQGLRQILFYWLNKLQPKTILDAGCGTGINLKTALDLGYNATGFEPDSNGIKFCKSRGLTNIINGKLQEKLYEPNSFDLIYCLDVLYILDEDTIFKGLKNLNRYLKFGGHLIINSATYQWLYSTHDRATYTYKRYSQKELEKFLRKSGFKTVKSTHRIFFLFPIIVLVKLAEKFMSIFARNKKLDEKGDLEKNSLLVNILLKPIMTLENWILKRFNLPLGSSVFIVAKKV